MAMENKRIIQLNTERTTPAVDDYVMVDSATAGTAKYLLPKITDAIDQEISDRTSADTTLQGNITAEATTRAAADTAINGEITQLKEDLYPIAKQLSSLTFDKTATVTPNGSYRWATPSIPNGSTVKFTNNSSVALTLNVQDANSTEQGIASNVSANGGSVTFVAPFDIAYIRSWVGNTTTYSVTVTYGFDEVGELQEEVNNLNDLKDLTPSDALTTRNSRLGLAYEGSVGSKYSTTTYYAYRVSNPEPIRYGDGELILDISSGYRGSFRVIDDNDYIVAAYGWITSSASYPTSSKYRYAFTNDKNGNEATQEDILAGVHVTFKNALLEKVDGSSFYNVKAVSHRGFNTEAPENTLPAFQLAKTKGYRYAETDVRFTSDGVPVLLHDASINRTARNADGTAISETVNIRDITYEQALAYDFGIWKGEEYAGTKIPTLKEFMLFCKNIGITPRPEFNSPMSDAEITLCMGIINDCGMLGKTEYAVTWASGVDTILSFYDEAVVVWGTGAISSDLISAITSRKTRYNKFIICAEAGQLTSATIELASDAHIPVEVWTVNNASYVVPDYVTGVTSDSLDFAKILYNKNIN